MGNTLDDILLRENEREEFMDLVNLLNDEGTDLLFNIPSLNYYLVNSEGEEVFTDA